MICRFNVNFSRRDNRIVVMWAGIAVTWNGTVVMGQRSYAEYILLKYFWVECHSVPNTPATENKRRRKRRTRSEEKQFLSEAGDFLITPPKIFFWL